MTEYYPGTVVKREGRSAADFLQSIFFTDSGLSMSQVKELCGLDSFIVQNWVSRGWVGKPQNKRYYKDRFSRILLINMLRTVAKLEDIAKVLRYINGEANNPADDIIEEAELYILLCDLFDRLEDSGLDIERQVKDVTALYRGSDVFRATLERGLTILAHWHMAAQYKAKADKLLGEIISEERLEF